MMRRMKVILSSTISSLAWLDRDQAIWSAMALRRSSSPPSVPAGTSFQGCRVISSIVALALVR
jgi:hypothetical protein